MEVAEDKQTAMRLAQDRLRQIREDRFSAGREIQVRGLNYHRTALVNFHAGAEVSFRHEPRNPNDPNAIRAYHGENHIGYVARELAPAMKRFLDAGGAVKAVFNGHIYSGAWNGFVNLKTKTAACLATDGGLW